MPRTAESTIEAAQNPRRATTTIPTVVLARICHHLHIDHAQRSLLNVMLTSRLSYEIAAGILYRDVYITGRSFDSLFLGLIIDVDPDPDGPLPPTRFPWMANLSQNNMALAKEVVARLEQSNAETEERDIAFTEQKEAGMKPGFFEEMQKGFIKRVETYLESISDPKLLGLALPASHLDLDKYPNTESQHRKLALFHRCTRLVVYADDLRPENIRAIYGLACRTDDLLFPRVETLVVQETSGTSFKPCAFERLDFPFNRWDHPATLLPALFEAACPKTICLWNQTTPEDIEELSKWVHLARYDHGKAEPNPGRVGTYTCHNVYHQPPLVMQGALNRYYFDFNPAEAMLTAKDGQYSRRACSREAQEMQAEYILWQACAFQDDPTTKLELFNAGRLDFDDNGAIIMAETRDIIKTAFARLSDDIADFGVYDDDDQDDDQIDVNVSETIQHLTGMMTLRLSPDLDPCPGCADLDFGGEVLPKLQSLSIAV